MGQQPNIELEMADLPRPTEHPGAPRRWSPTRVGELGRPADVPHGGRFGNPGPDAGYALILLKDRDIPTAPGESRRDAIAAIAALMTKMHRHRCQEVYTDRALSIKLPYNKEKFRRRKRLLNLDLYPFFLQLSCLLSVPKCPYLSALLQ